MKNLMPQISIMAFICFILFSCENDIEKPDYTNGNGTTVTKMDYSGTWVATQITYIYGNESIKLPDNILNIKICVYDYHSICLINGSDAWYSTSKFGDNPDSYFGNQINQCSIQTRIIDFNPTELQVKIENLTPFLFKLCPEEQEDGYYLATLRRSDGLY